MLFIIGVLIAEISASQNFFVSLAQNQQQNLGDKCLAQVYQKQDENSSEQSMQKFFLQANQYVQKTEENNQSEKERQIQSYRDSIQKQTDKIRLENLELFETIRKHYEKELKREKKNFEEFKLNIKKILNQLNQQCKNCQNFIQEQ